MYPQNMHVPQSALKTAKNDIKWRRGSPSIMIQSLRIKRYINIFKKINGVFSRQQITKRLSWNDI